MFIPAIPSHASPPRFIRVALVAAAIFLGLVLAPSPASAAVPVGAANAHFKQAGVPIYARSRSDWSCGVWWQTCVNTEFRPTTAPPPFRYSRYAGEALRAHCYNGVEVKVTYEGTPLWVPMSGLEIAPDIEPCGLLD